VERAIETKISVLIPLILRVILELLTVWMHEISPSKALEKSSALPILEDLQLFNQAEVKPSRYFFVKRFKRLFFKNATYIKKPKK